MATNVIGIPTSALLDTYYFLPWRPRGPIARTAEEAPTEMSESEEHWEAAAMKQNTKAYSLPGLSPSAQNKTTGTYFPMKRPKQQSNVPDRLDPLLASVRGEAALVHKEEIGGNSMPDRSAS